MRDAMKATIRMVRTFARRPAFPLLVVAGLGIGMAVSLAALGLAKQVLLDPLPYEDAERVVILHRASEDGGRGGLTWGALGDLEASDAFQGLAGVSIPGLDRSITLTGGAYSERIRGLRVTPDFFRVLGVRPARGRDFGGGAEAGEEVILSHESWQRRYGARPMVGEAIRVNGRPRVVAGILPPGFHYGLEPDAELFLSFRPTGALAADREAGVVQGVARVGVAGPPLARTLERLDGPIRAASSTVDLPALAALPVRDFFYGDLTRRLVFLAVAGGLTLLVAVVNVALLVLARLQRRRNEYAIRAALGAGRWDLAATPLGEAAVLALVATGVGLLGARGLLAGLHALDPGSLPMIETLVLDPPLVAAALGLALASAGLVALLPALRLRGVDVGALRIRKGSLSSRELRRWNVLVAAQTALVAFLLLAAGLTGRSLAELLRVDAGFEPGGAYALEFSLPADEYGSLEAVAAYVRRLEERLSDDPVVVGAGVATNLPLTPGWGGEMAVRDGPTDPGEVAPVDWEMVSPGYFEAMGIDLLRGRGFRFTDDADGPRVTVVNETLARRHWPDGGAVGARISGTGPEGPWHEVVGVVEDVRQDGLARKVEPMMYVAHAQVFALRDWKLVVRAEGAGAGGLPARARAALRRLEPRVVVGEVRPLGSLVREDTAETRLQTALLSLFGGAGLFLGLAGIFGVVSYAVARRRREIGIRMALGADRGSVVGRILRSGLLPVLAGLGAGLGAALLTGSYYRELLFGVSLADPVVYLGLPPLLLLAAAAALLLPAIRASRVDPARVLAEE